MSSRRAWSLVAPALRLTMLVASAGILAACSSSTAKESDGGSGDGAARAAQGQAEFQALLASFDVLQTLAGTGLFDNDTNDWKPAFEGGPAIQAELSTPHNAAGDDAGNTFIADKDAHAIRKVAPDGTIVTVAGVNVAGDDGDAPGPGVALHLTQPNGLWVRGDGTVYILDLGNSKIRKLDSAGQLSTLFTIQGLSTGRGLWVSPDEATAFVASGNRVLRWTAAGGVETYASGFLDLGNLYVDADGIAYATDRGASSVFRIGADRRAVLFAGGGTSGFLVDGSPALEAGLLGVRGVWPAKTPGAFFLATHEGNQVLYLDSFGFVHVLLNGAHDAHLGDGQPLSTAGLKVSEVRSVSVNPAGDLIVVEHDGGFVRIARHKPGA